MITVVLAAVLLIEFVLLSLAIFVILSKRSLLNISYVTFNILTVAWLAVNFISTNFKEIGEAKVALYADFILAPIVLLTLGLFSWQLIKVTTNKKPALAWLITSLGLEIVTLLIIFNSTITQASTGGIQQLVFHNTTHEVAYFVSVLILSIIPMFNLFISKKYANKESFRSQADLMLRGAFIAIALILIANQALPFLTSSEEINLLGGNIAYLGIMIFEALIAVAFIKHKFLDVRLLVARSTAYVLLLTSFLLLYLLFGTYLASSIFDIRLSVAQQLFYVAIAIFLAILYQPLKKLFDKITSTIFFRDNYDTQEVLNEFSDYLVAELDTKNIIDYTLNILNESIRPSKSSILLYEPKEKSWHDMDGSLRNTVRKKLSKTLEYQSKSILITDELEQDEIDPFTRNILEVLKTEYVLVSVRLSTKNQLVGFLLLGNKKSGGDYTSQDLRFLSILANELSVALQNASRFSEIQQFNVRLQEEIDQATKELRSSNIKLKALDEAKDEFISMASHQLRTPLTSIKGYLSMILEGDVGQVSDKQKSMIDAAFTSSQRMVYLISDLLNVSRLRTGKFVIETTEVYLPDVVAGEVIQLVATAHARGIKLNFEKPDSFPKAMLDETKIRQVIMNFIDNAIYYNKDGGHIEVRLKSTKDNIQFLVEDDGIGVPRQEQHKLFSKFFRAENARKARPDGTGLGLFMAKKVVVAQGGSIIFKSTPGEGSTFGFLFPLSKVAVTEINTT